VQGRNSSKHGCQTPDNRPFHNRRSVHAAPLTGSLICGGPPRFSSPGRRLPRRSPAALAKNTCKPMRRCGSLRGRRKARSAGDETARRIGETPWGVDEEGLHGLACCPSLSSARPIAAGPSGREGGGRELHRAHHFCAGVGRLTGGLFFCAHRTRTRRSILPGGSSPRD
jgi:hypothetical protein